MFSKEQRKQRTRLTSKAQTMAQAALRGRHRAEYDLLYAEAKKVVGLE